MPEHPHNFTDATFCVPRITHPAPRTTLESHVPHTTRHAPLESASGSTTHPWATSRERIPQGDCLRLPFDIVCLGCLRPQRQFINRYPPLCVIHIHNRLVSVRPRTCATSSRTRAKNLTPARGLRKPLRTLRKHFLNDIPPSQASPVAFLAVLLLVTCGSRRTCGQIYDTMLVIYGREGA